MTVPDHWAFQCICPTPLPLSVFGDCMALRLIFFMHLLSTGVAKTPGCIHLDEMSMYFWSFGVARCQDIMSRIFLTGLIH